MMIFEYALQILLQDRRGVENQKKKFYRVALNENQP